MSEFIFYVECHYVECRYAESRGTGPSSFFREVETFNI
jgi:hypothetical protein